RAKERRTAGAQTEQALDDRNPIGGVGDTVDGGGLPQPGARMGGDEAAVEFEDPPALEVAAEDEGREDDEVVLRAAVNGDRPPAAAEGSEPVMELDGRAEDNRPPCRGAPGVFLRALPHI